MSEITELETQFDITRKRIEETKSIFSGAYILSVILDSADLINCFQGHSIEGSAPSENYVKAANQCAEIGFIFYEAVLAVCELYKMNGDLDDASQRLWAAVAQYYCYKNYQTIKDPDMLKEQVTKDYNEEIERAKKLLDVLIAEDLIEFSDHS